MTKLYHIDIDCPVCAEKVENALRINKSVNSVKLDYISKTLRIDSPLTCEEIVALSTAAEDEIVFFNLEESVKVKAELKDSNKVVSSLLDNEEVYTCSYENNALVIKTALPISDIKRLVRKADESATFSEKEVKTEVFKVKKLKDTKRLEKALSLAKGVMDFSVKEKEVKIISALSRDKLASLLRRNGAQILEHDENYYTLIRIIIALSIMVLAFALENVSTHFNLLFVVSYLVAGYDVLIKAVKNIFKGKVFDECFLMSIATIGALALSSYSEAAAVMVFYQVGEYFQDKAVGKSRASIADLMDIKSETATVIRDGEAVELECEEIVKDEIIIVKAGERVALDGIVEEGESFLDLKALTGEAVPVKVAKGEEVLSGAVNQNAVLKIKVTKEYKDSTVNRILSLVETSSEKKSEKEKFITKFSRYYTPSVILLALIIAIVPPLLGMGTFSLWIYRALIILVVSCPCAIVLSVPLAYFASIGSYAKEGILVKGAISVQNLAKVSLLAFDKTGTLTKGEFEVQNVTNYTDTDVLAIASSLESFSTHPIAKAIVRSCPSTLLARGVVEIPGKGIKGVIDGQEYRCGSSKLFKEAQEAQGSLVYVGTDEKVLGYIEISDELKESTAEAISSLRALGVNNLVMLSGDKKETAEEIGHRLSLDRVESELLPDEKLRAFNALKREGEIASYCGDGINDAPALASADVGIAMGGVGSQAAIEAADCVIMSDDLRKISAGISISRKTEKIIIENIVFAIAVKVLVILLATLGVSNMWLAIFADVGVALLCVLNSMRAMKI